MPTVIGSLSRIQGSHFFLLIELIAVTVATGAGLLLTRWIEDCRRDPATQRRVAGERAEEVVREMIETMRGSMPGTYALHGELYVFNPGKENEFSVEADHIVISEHHVYLVETKYKSGTIFAVADADEWITTSSNGQGKMRNALRQATQSARILQREMGLPSSIIPVVAIVGNDVVLRNSSSNVVAASQLVSQLRALEATLPSDALKPAQIQAMFVRHIRTDPAARHNHIARAQITKARNQAQRPASAQASPR